MKKPIILLYLLCSIASQAPAQITRPVQTDNGLLKILLDPNSKTWSLFERQGDAWRVAIAGATVSLAFRDRDSLILSGEQAPVTTKTDEFSDEIGKGRRIVMRAEGPEAGWAITLDLYDNKKILGLSATAANKTSSEWRPSRFHILDVGGAGYLGFDTNRVLMHVNGYQSWSNCDVVRLDSANRNTSYWSTLFDEPEVYSSLLIGFVTNSLATNSITTTPMAMETGQIQISSTSELSPLAIPPGSEARSDRMIIAFDASPLDNLQRYGEYLQMFAPSVNKPFTPAGKSTGSGAATPRVPAGWCSWYYYYQHISEDSILENLNLAAKDLKQAGLRTIQIDDGYQIAAGDWNTNDRFPHGHEWLVNQIHQKGFLAGLWVAPFAVAESSSVFKEHRDWLLRDAGDTLKQFFANDWWGGRIYSLDPTKKEVQLWLENLFYRITNAWGYDYVKIDFLYFPGEAGRYSRQVSATQAYQMGLQAIRRGCGSDKFILGCGAPIGPSIGIVDGMRIGGDVYAGWGGITPCVKAAATRWFYHRAVWDDDPDCLVVRDPLTVDQARAWAAVVSLSGQMNLLSDRLASLPADRVDLLRMTLPVYDRGARPVDLLSEPKESGLTLRPAEGDGSIPLPDQWMFSPGDSMARKDPGFDDAQWKEISIPSRWEDAGYTGLDGFAWYRVKFSVPAGWKHGPMKLYLGRIDDCDETYLNGTLVGKSGTLPPGYVTDWTSFRIYTIPEALMNWEGENTIAVRAYDGGGPGGFYSIRQLTLPSIWNLGVEKEFEKWNVVGLFNWSNDESDVAIETAQLGLSPAKTYVAYELWGDRYAGEFRNKSSYRLKPTSSQIFSIHEKLKRPFILSTSRHITQGAVDLAYEEWNPSTHILSVTSGNLVAGAYSAIVFVPQGFEFKGVVSPVRCDTTSVSGEVVKLNFTIGKKNSISWKVRFAQAGGGE
ncbi:MAG TPA: alpha-galactosidase [Bacteroidota bacterium]|jgi:hypothetical protein